MRRLLTSVVLLALSPALLAQSAATATAPAAQADVPVKAVVLFSSGVGYFEHFGSVNGNGSTELRFKTNQINDILKSLILQDMDGGKVSSVSYPSQDPIAKTLRSFQVDITGNPPLADLLNQLRGAKITLAKADGTKITGTVLGVEKKQRISGDDKKTPIEVAVLNIINGAQIRSIQIDDLSDIQLDDPALQAELGKALAALAQSRDQDKKPVSINFRGDGERRVRIGYIVETPIWKTSYRLILPAGAQDKPRLQGWAIVENQTENDWNGIQLSLVSGRPISFVQDLYQPLYIPRPVVRPELFASLRPQTYDDGIANGRERAEFGIAASPAPIGARGGRGGGGGGGGGAGARVPAAAARALSSDAAATPMESELRAQQFSKAEALDPAASIASVASAAKVGELFQYTVGEPVTLARQKSAMLPIINDDVECEKLSIYNASVLPKNPLNGARLKNTTGKHLLQGPITVLESSSYAGDARIDNVPPGQERLLSYGIDLQMKIDSTKNKQEDRIQSGKIVKGVLTIARKVQATQDYIADNSSDHEKTLVIEHPIKPNWKLVDTRKPEETTDTLYRFKGTVPSNKASTFTVKEEIVTSETVEILPIDIEQVLIYSKTGEFPQKVRDALAEAAKRKQVLVDAERTLEQNAQKIAFVTQEQSRTRENLRVIGQNNRTGEYYKKLETTMQDQDTQLIKLSDEKDQLTKKRDEVRTQLEDYLNGMTIE